MTKGLLREAAFILLTTGLLSSGVAMAQDAPAPTTNGGAGIRAGNISGTGRTMPNVGAPKGAGTTSLDRGIQQEDNKITSGICKGC